MQEVSFIDRWPEVLKEATEWGLLSHLPDVPAYLQLQPTLPYFLRSRLTTPEQQPRKQAIETAFRQVYDGFAREIYQLLDSKEAQQKQLGQGFARLEYENLTTALNLALAAHVSILNPYVALSNYLDTTHDEGRGLQLGEMVLARLESYTAEALAGSLGQEVVGVVDDIARRQLLLKRYSEAQESYQKALTIWLDNQSLSAENRRHGSASIYHQLGRVAQKQREWEPAEVEELFRQIVQADDASDGGAISNRNLSGGLKREIP